MTPIDDFAWFVFIVMIVSIMAAFIGLAALQGKLAQARCKDMIRMNAIKVSIKPH